jgi:2-polyprenyl-3-methyl-5-hydroxy-6-metoxy-1,4-benzoquinol methylase
MPDRQAHWENVYTTKGETEVSWFQQTPAISLDLIKATGATASSAIVDIGGGASRLVDCLLRDGFHSVTVLDLSQAALAAARGRIGSAADKVDWIATDVTRWTPSRQYDVWHDRAAFHFLTDPQDRAAYVERLTSALRPGGHAIIGTFALDGPEKCSGLPVQRHDSASLQKALGHTFKPVDTRRETHKTPWNSTQSFEFTVFRHALAPADRAT